MANKEMSFVQAMKDYFGLRPGTTNTDFMKEMKSLSDEERAWFVTNLGKVGYTVTGTAAAAAR